jgi:hypothetical protein
MTTTSLGAGLTRGAADAATENRTADAAAAVKRGKLRMAAKMHRHKTVASQNWLDDDV